MTYIVSSGALNSTHSLSLTRTIGNFHSQNNTRYDSDVIQSTVVNAAMLEVYYFNSVTSYKLTHAFKLICVELGLYT